MSKKDISKQEVTDLFTDGGAESIGLDKDSEGIVVANLNATTLPMCVGTPVEEIDTDDVTIIFLLIDGSGSMGDHESVVIDAINEELIGGLKGASKKAQQSIHLGGCIFSSGVTPLWGGGFKKLEDIPPLTTRDYNPSRNGGMTALFDAQLDGVTAAAVYASQVLGGSGTPPKTIIACFSDGADNASSVSASKVKSVYSKLDPEMFITAFMGFKALWDDDIDFNQIAADTGFRSVMTGEAGKNDSLADRQRKMRHMLKLFSSSIIRQSQTTIDPNASASFFQVTDEGN